VGGEEDVGLGVGGGEGEDVPDVDGDDIGGEEVDLGGGVGGAVVVEAAAVGVFLASLEGAFYLHPQELALVVDDEVVGGVVSAGPCEDEAEFGGAELEKEFGPLSAEFGVVDVFALGHAVIRLWVKRCGAICWVLVMGCLCRGRRLRSRFLAMRLLGMTSPFKMMGQ